jgi:biopolymer transport protein ExbD
MLHVRRSTPEPRIELMPLIDVVFLLLTFFLFAMVLMVRAEVLDLNLPTLGSAETAEGGSFITIALDDADAIFVDGEPVSAVELGDAVRARQEANPRARLVIAADLEGGRDSLIRLFDVIARERLGEVMLVGRPKASQRGGGP